MERLIYYTVLTLAVNIMCISTDEEVKGQIAAFINDILECTRIPGMMLAVVHDGRTVLTEGYGKANLDTGENVTSKTLFNIASVSKHMSTLLAASYLAAHPTFDWDTPIREIIGEDFHYSSGYRSNETNLRDLTGHKLGHSRDDFAWILNTLEREDVIKRLHLFAPNKPLRSGFDYNNYAFVVAAEAASMMDGRGRSFEQLMQEMFFDPLNMTDTTYIYELDEYDERLAVPYLDVDEPDPTPIEFFKNLRIIGPAGGVASNAEDMARWLHYLLGNLDGDDGIDSSIVNDLLVDENPLGNPPMFEKPEYQETVDPLSVANRGLYRGTYKGYRMWSHLGGNFGYTSYISFIPSAGIGIYQSQNSGDRDFEKHLIHTYITDLLLGETPWFNSTFVCDPDTSRSLDSEAFQPSRDITINNKKAHLARLSKYRGKYLPKPTANEQYVGTYGNYLYGNTTVRTNDNDTLELLVGLTPYVYDLIEVDEDLFWAEASMSPATHAPIGFVVFEELGEDGMDTVVLLFFPPARQESVVFRRGLNPDDAPAPDLNTCQD